MAGTRRKPGRMGPHVDGFQAWLVGRSYTPGTVRNMLKVLGQLGRWMASEDLEVAALNAASLAAFVRSCEENGVRRVPGMRSFSPLLDYLRAQGLVDDESHRRRPSKS